MVCKGAVVMAYLLNCLVSFCHKIMVNKLSESNVILWGGGNMTCCNEVV